MYGNVRAPARALVDHTQDAHRGERELKCWDEALGPRQRRYATGAQVANGRCWSQTAQTIRASLFATATAAMLCPRRCCVRNAQSCNADGFAQAFAWQRTDRAPWISSMRR